MAKTPKAPTKVETPEAPAPVAAKKVKFVKMVSEAGVEADVHPDEVVNYAKGGYTEAKG